MVVFSKADSRLLRCPALWAEKLNSYSLKVLKHMKIYCKFVLDKLEIKLNSIKLLLLCYNTVNFVYSLYSNIGLKLSLCCNFKFIGRLRRTRTVLEVYILHFYYYNIIIIIIITIFVEKCRVRLSQECKFL